MPSNLGRFVVWSNAFYLLPFAVALATGFLLDAVALAILIVCSTAYHASRERRYVNADLAASVLVIVVNAAACVLGDFKTPYFTAVWILAVAAFTIRYYFERGDRGSAAHGLWHALAALILTFCVLTFAA